MKKFQINQQSNSGSSRGFSLYGKVIETGIKQDDRNAILIEQVSGTNKGRRIVVSQGGDKGYRGIDLDENGLIAKKIKKGVTVGLQETRYLDKEGTQAQCRRVIKVGKDFRPDQSLLISSYGADINNLRAFLLTPKAGVHRVEELADPKLKLQAIIDTVNEVIPQLAETQGLAILLSTGEGDKQETVHGVVSRYEKQSATAKAELLSLEGFKSKVKSMLTPSAKMLDFEGTSGATIGDVFDDQPLKIVVVPSEIIQLTKSKFIDNGQRAVMTGVGSIGVGIAPPGEELPYAVINVGAAEMMGLVGFRGRGPKGEQFAGPKVRGQPNGFSFNRLVNQIDLLNGKTLADRVEDKVPPKEAPLINEAYIDPAEIHEHEQHEATHEEGSFVDNDPFANLSDDPFARFDDEDEDDSPSLF